MSFADLLITSTTQMFQSGKPLMSRLFEDGSTAETWAHYPPDDVVNGAASSRYFYHAHPPEERDSDEHGHFHLFLGKHVFDAALDAISDTPSALIPPPPLPDGQRRADVVHFAALSIGYDGLPLRWFGTNRWVTDEWLYPADDVIERLGQFDMRGPSGDPLVNDWLTAMVHLAREEIADLLHERDAVLKTQDMTGENRDVEVTGVRVVDFEALLS
ncbi:DUF6969 family protein [Qipengyuania sp. DGS5-3]|uniref:DUF6969 family protein n=1 Tax=Qipengyuania sp. DGS5-3 TaxID=3349632 RepID=UPI0036D43C72